MVLGKLCNCDMKLLSITMKLQICIEHAFVRLILWHFGVLTLRCFGVSMGGFSHAACPTPHSATDSPTATKLGLCSSPRPNTKTPTKDARPSSDPSGFMTMTGSLGDWNSAWVAYLEIVNQSTLLRQLDFASNWWNPCEWWMLDNPPAPRCLPSHGWPH